MIYSGTITNDNSIAIPGATISFINAAGTALATIPTDNDGVWTIDTEFDSGLIDPGMSILFAAPGYSSYSITTAQLPTEFYVKLKRKTNVILPWMVVAVLAAVLIIQQSKKKKGKVGKIETKDVTVILYILGGIIAFTIVKKILEWLGIWESPDAKKLKQIKADKNSFWNPTYWQTINPSQSGWTFALTEDQANDYLKTIHNSFGIFGDDEDGIKGVFRQMRTKANVSFLAYINNRDWGQDLLSYLQSGGSILPYSGLSSSDIVEINDFIQQLPNY